MPCGTKMPVKRVFVWAAAVWPASARAGIIASSNGSASMVPAPRRKVRRGMCILVRYMVIGPPRASGSSRTLLLLLCDLAWRRGGRLHVHLELPALDDAQDQR